MTRSAAGRLVAWTMVAIAAALLAPAAVPLDASVHPLGNAITLGGLTGAFVFYALARQRLPRNGGTVDSRRLVARSIVLSVRSAQEEAVWRALVLGMLVAPLGRLGALVASTTLFAGAHVLRQGRAATAHLVTGSAFGVVFLLTGRLSGAIAAHSVYNVLVGTASLRETPSLSDTGTPVTPVVRSVAPSSRPFTMDDPSLAPVASLADVVKTFGSARALDGVDLELRRGEILALLGPNGAGKSTAVAIMLGLRRPDVGNATLFGGDPRAAGNRKRAGAVLQDVSFPPGLRVCDAVDLVRAHFADAPPLGECLARLGLEEQSRRDAGGLSGGQRRRLAVALALTGRPQALFLDEPTAGIDAHARRALLADIVSFAAAGGSVLLTTQQLAEAEEIATRVVVLARGRVLVEGSVSDVRARGGLSRVTFRAASLPHGPGVVSADSTGDRHVVLVQDADAFVGALVRAGMAFADLEVARTSLEDAFVALVKDSA